MNTGFFTMADVTEIAAMKSVDEAKSFAINKVNSMPKATPANIRKAMAAINNANSVYKLVMTLSNFVLAHPSEGLKVI